MIQDVQIWQNIIINYHVSERKLHWDENKIALQKIITEFPNSQWVDDAELLLACGEASFELNFNNAISRLREIIKNYNSEKTIVTGWQMEIGGLLDNTWVMWTPGLVAWDKNKQIIKEYPLDVSGPMSNIEKEVLAYFNHLEKYPRYTNNIASFIIAMILQKQGDTSGAISELEIMISENNDIETVNSADRKAAESVHGYLIGCTPFSNRYPIWRIQYSAYTSLINLYLIQDKIEKASQTALTFVSKCSHDGRYWNINKFVGEFFESIGRKELAKEQYLLALEGINYSRGMHISRFERLHASGNVIKPKNFKSWDHHTLELFRYDINQIEKLLESVQK